MTSSRCEQTRVLLCLVQNRCVSKEKRGLRALLAFFGSVPLDLGEKFKVEAEGF